MPDKKTEQDTPKAAEPQIEAAGQQAKEETARMYRENFARQLDETVTILNETNNISTLFARCNFLFKLRDNIRLTNVSGLSDVLAETNSHIKRIDEYINLFVLRQFAIVDEEVAIQPPNVAKRRYKKLYERLDAQKNNMAENEIYTYTSVCQQRLGVDTMSLPQYSALLCRLNNTFLGSEISSEYYDEWFGSLTEAVRFLKQKGYLTVSEDNKRYALTEIGIKETGWL